jgi:uncharacterized protein involved in type VI secretion and phage assembly
MSADTARSSSTDKKFFGVVEALVSEIVDPEDEARVKVSYPRFDQAMVSEWARVAQPYAGNDYGFVFVPEVGDEVLVAFVQGDMRFPIIVGGLYNGVDKPPTSPRDDRDQKLIRTKGEHELLLDDTADSKRARLKTAGGHTLDLDDEGKTLAVSSTAGHKVVLDDNAKSITLETADGQSVVLDGSSGKVTISATSVTLDASTISLGSTASHAVLLGDLFVTMFNTHVHPTAVGPSGPPTPPLVGPAVLSQTTRTS